MNFKFGLLFTATFVFLNVSTSSSSNDAVNECAKEHNIELSSLSTVNGSFSNGKCMLECTVGSVALPADLMHEGQACPEDASGLCHQGHCIGGLNEALLECGLEHRVDFHKADHRGTAFTNDQCMLRCVLGGTEMSVNHKHEGSKCPANSNGVCRSGICVVQSTNPVSTVTTFPPTTVTQASIDSFSPSKMKLLNISLESTDPILKQNQLIDLNFYETNQSIEKVICRFYGDSAHQNWYWSQEMSTISSTLNKASQISIELADSVYLTAQKEDLYPLFATFYQNHQLAFGTQENFVAKFPIYRKVSPHEKLMDVTLRFTIVFSKD